MCAGCFSYILRAPLVALLRFPPHFFFFNDPATTEIYTLSLHDALPISCRPARPAPCVPPPGPAARRSSSAGRSLSPGAGDRKSTRLNSSHLGISYAVFCLKKKKKKKTKKTSEIIKQHV